MNRKIFCLALCALLFALGVSAQAQQPKKVPRIGYLSAQDPASESARTEAIKLALRERGYIEGQNIAIEYRYSEGKVDRAPELAAELVHLKMDLIVAAGGDPWIRAAKNATKTIPIVMVGSGTDPVEAGFVESLARPGGNVTGLTNLIQRTRREAAGAAQRSRFQNCPCRSSLRSGQSAECSEVKEVLPVTAGTMRLTVQPLEVRAADDFEKVFAAISKQRPDGLYVLTSPLMRSNAKRIAGAALKSRLPSVYGRRESVDAVGSCTTGRTKRTATGALHITWTKS